MSSRSLTEPSLKRAVCTHSTCARMVRVCECVGWNRWWDARARWRASGVGAQARRRAGAQTSEKRGSDIRAEQEVVSLWCAPQMRPAPEQSSARDSQGAIRFAPSARGSSLRTHRRRRQQNIEAIQDGVPTPFSLENTRSGEPLSDAGAAGPPLSFHGVLFLGIAASDRSDTTATKAPRQYHDFPCGAKPQLETYETRFFSYVSRPHPQRRLSGRRGLWREIVRGRVIAGGSVTTHASSCS